MPASIAPWLLAALAVLPAAARAEARASVRLADFGYALTDLDPGDGFAPAATIHPASGIATLSVLAAYLRPDQPAQPPDYVVDYQEFRTILPTAQSGVTLAHAGASVSMGGDVASHGYTFEAQGRAGAGADPLRASYFHVNALPAIPEWNGFDLVLSPFTRLDWSGHVSLAASVARPVPGRRVESAQAFFQGQLLDAADASLIGQPTEVLLNVDSLDTGAPSGRRQQFRFQLAWVNDTAESATAKLVLSMAAFGSNAPMPVPEAATWALLAGGCIVVGAAARRRARAQPPSRGVPT